MVQDTIRARRIELIDETGTRRAVVQANSEGLSGIVVHDVGGTGADASIGVNDDGTPFLRLRGGRDEGEVFAAAVPGGPVVVQVIDKNGEEAELRV